MFAIKLALVFCRGIAATVCCGCLFFAAGLLLQGVAQLEGEGLAKRPETAEEVWTRLQGAFALLSLGFCGSVVFQAAGVFSGRWGGVDRSRVRKAVFTELVFWAGVCLFFCLLILAASTQARWEVARLYYWLAGGAGVLALVLLGAVELFADGKQGPEQAAGAARGRSGRRRP